MTDWNYLGAVQCIARRPTSFTKQSPKEKYSLKWKNKFKWLRFTAYCIAYKSFSTSDSKEVEIVLILSDANFQDIKENIILECWQLEVMPGANTFDISRIIAELPKGKHPTLVVSVCNASEQGPLQRHHRVLQPSSRTQRVRNGATEMGRLR